MRYYRATSRQWLIGRWSSAFPANRVALSNALALSLGPFHIASKSCRKCRPVADSMKHLALVLSVAAASLLGGCASQSQMAKPDARAYQAYIAGQRDATGRPQNRAVTIQGDVKNHLVP